MLTAHVFQPDLLSGCLCLEFTNTVSWHASAQPEEWFNSYADLIHWARRAKMLDDQQTEMLIHLAEAEPEEAAQVLQRAIALREAIYHIGLALIARQHPTPGDLALLNAELARQPTTPRVVAHEQHFVWEWPLDVTSLDALLAPIARSAAELLISEERERLGQCADVRGCGWLFLDMTRNRSRRWCSMEDCGNRAKQRRHYQRQSSRQDV